MAVTATPPGSSAETVASGSMDNELRRPPPAKNCAENSRPVSFLPHLVVDHNSAPMFKSSPQPPQASPRESGISTQLSADYLIA